MAENIYLTVRLFLYYSQIFGLSPVILRRRGGKNHFQPFWLGILYNIMLSALLAFSFQFSYGNIEMFADNDSEIMFMHTVCKLVLGPICVGIIFISSILSSRNLCNVINKLSEYDQVFQKHIAVMRYKWIKWIFLCCFLISLGVCSAYFYNEDVVLRKVSERQLSIYEFISFFVSWCLFDIISWTLILVVFSFLYLVYKKFYQINEKLVTILSDYDKTIPDSPGMDREFKVKDRLFHSPSSIFHIEGSARSRISTPGHNFSNQFKDERKFAVKKVAQIRHLHILLVNISENLNSIFATRIMAIVSLNVILLCFSSFLLILMLVLGRRDSVLMTAVIWVCVRFFPTCVLIFPFCLVMNEAERTSILIHESLSRTEEVAMREELRIFSMQLTNRKLVFTSHGFFNLDGRTVVATVGAAFAYLVVLLQFHMTLSNLKKNSASNDTTQPKDSM
ncbi:UNVERIFIED_CONTAM: hypothetical protein PYX00_000986 [Menopon gallinae]|uniref:Gustatory receptor n=1 Tax=Menopon gallinae TaxID=328185 RepID=A0AAW2IBV5_9NEOP